MSDNISFYAWLTYLVVHGLAHDQILSDITNQMRKGAE